MTVSISRTLSTTEEAGAQVAFDKFRLEFPDSEIDDVTKYVNQRLTDVLRSYVDQATVAEINNIVENYKKADPKDRTALKEQADILAAKVAATDAEAAAVAEVNP